MLILASAGDAPELGRYLRGPDSEIFFASGFDQFLEEARRGAGTLFLDTDRLGGGDIASLAELLGAQPSWSDLPIVLLTPEAIAGNSPAALQAWESLGNVTLLERPMRSATVASTIRSALRARRRQYEVRDRLADLMRVEEVLRRSNEDLGQFAYAVSHDLQEPLRMIGSYVQLLERRYKDQLDADAHEYIHMVSSSVSRLFQLVSDLLAYSQAGTREGKPEAVNFNEVMLWVKMNLQHAISESGAAISWDTLPTVLMDQGQALQLLQNLVSNAIKYRSTAAPVVSLSAVRSGADWVVTVQDNGIGFEPQYAERIFGVFKRLHGRDVPGTGIGLALCRKIVEKHGGHIWAESTPGEGSKFRFCLPALRQTEAAETL